MRVCELLIEGSISKVYFRYTAKLEVYTNSISDIPCYIPFQKDSYISLNLLNEGHSCQ